MVVIAPFSSMRVLSSLKTTDLRGLRSGMGCSCNTVGVNRLLIVAKIVEIARNVCRGQEGGCLRVTYHFGHDCGWCYSFLYVFRESCGQMQTILGCLCMSVV